jgi:hypothetical protein
MEKYLFVSRPPKVKSGQDQSAQIRGMIYVARCVHCAGYDVK